MAKASCRVVEYVVSAQDGKTTTHTYKGNLTLIRAQLLAERLNEKEALPQEEGSPIRSYRAE